MQIAKIFVIGTLLVCGACVAGTNDSQSQVSYYRVVFSGGYALSVEQMDMDFEARFLRWYEGIDYCGHNEVAHHRGSTVIIATLCSDSPSMILFSNDEYELDRISYREYIDEVSAQGSNFD